MNDQKTLHIEKVIEVILGLCLILKGHTVFGATLITFGLITATIRYR